MTEQTDVTGKGGFWLSFFLVVAVLTIALGANLFGYIRGLREGNERAVILGAREATTECVATQIVTLRNITRAIRASNDKDRTAALHAAGLDTRARGQ